MSQVGSHNIHLSGNFKITSFVDAKKCFTHFMKAVPKELRKIINITKSVHNLKFNGLMFYH